VVDQTRHYENLKAVSRVWKKNHPERASQSDAHAVVDMITTLLEEERPVENRDSLKVAYGLIEIGTSRDERIRHHLERPKNQRAAHSVSTKGRPVTPDGS
jgi:hypothetical protein